MIAQNGGQPNVPTAGKGFDSGKVLMGLNMIPQPKDEDFAAILGGAKTGLGGAVALGASGPLGLALGAAAGLLVALFD
jgi:hypothetical protein